MRWRYGCEECGKIFCAKCIIKFEKYDFCVGKKPTDNYKEMYLCKNCWDSVVFPFHEKYYIAFNNNNLVESFPYTYKGRIPVNDKEIIDLESEFLREKDDALKQLQVTALIEGKNLLYNVKYTKETGSRPGTGDETYYFSVWKAKAKAGRNPKEFSI